MGPLPSAGGGNVVSRGGPRSLARYPKKKVVKPVWLDDFVMAFGAWLRRAGVRSEGDFSHQLQDAWTTVAGEGSKSGFAEIQRSRCGVERRRVSYCVKAYMVEDVVGFATQLEVDSLCNVDGFGERHVPVLGAGPTICNAAGNAGHTGARDQANPRQGGDPEAWIL